MKVDRPLLEILIVDVARKRFGRRHFERGRILSEVEEHLRATGAWEPSDDQFDPPSSPKSRGQKTIDFCFSDLAAKRSVISFDRNNWGLAPELVDNDPLAF